MPCDTRLKPRQTIQERAKEVRTAVERISELLTRGAVKPVIGPNGAFALQGLSDQDRDGVTDNCAFRRIMMSGTASAKMAIARAEQLAGRTVNRQTVATGAHAHDDGRGGLVWHSHKG